MVKKKIDNRIRVMIENGVKLGHRTMILLVGDKGRDQVSFFSLHKCTDVTNNCSYFCIHEELDSLDAEFNTDESTA